MQEVSEKYNNDSYRERHALSVERLRTLPFEESVEDSYIAYFRLVALFLLEVENVRIQVESGKWDQYNEEDMRQINEILYSDIVGDAYEKSYANPKYAKISFTAAQSRNTARTQKTNFISAAVSDDEKSAFISTVTFFSRSFVNSRRNSRM